MKRFRQYRGVFLTLTVVAGAAYWLSTDEANWWLYVGHPQRGGWPKSRLSLPEQMLICGVIGALVAAPVTLGVWIVAALWARLSRR